MPKRSHHNYSVYILTNKPKGSLYIGVTGGLDDRMERHLKGYGSKFTSIYKLKRLVYFEEFQYIEDAITREKQLKNWHRQWKINLIEQDNPEWEDLYKVGTPFMVFLNYSLLKLETPFWIGHILYSAIGFFGIYLFAKWAFEVLR